MNFQECLKVGKYYELETLKHIKYNTYEFSVGICKEWDIKTITDDKTIYYEVKSDLTAIKYGNICIEFNYKKKDSGINITTADFWVYYVIEDRKLNLYKVFIIPTNIIKEMINNKLYTRIVKCGDGYNSSCYLFKMDLFESYKLII
jgi:hypothetical protein